MNHFFFLIGQKAVTVLMSSSNLMLFAAKYRVITDFSYSIKQLWTTDTVRLTHIHLLINSD